MSESTENDGQTENPTVGEGEEVKTESSEPPFVPTPSTYVPSEEVVDKLRDLVTQKKEDLAERERLANMPKQPYVREEPRVGRNDPCPCGSGKKYKKCCMKS